MAGNPIMRPLEAPMRPVPRLAVLAVLLLQAGCSLNDLPHGGGTLDAVENPDPGEPSDVPGHRDPGTSL
jgi:hypothetical protein